MSNMLEEAIVDAAALKEAAIKNAENVIVEKYSADIREAVETLLEGEEGEDVEIPAQAPEGIPVGALPPTSVDEDTEMVIDLEELASLIDTIEEKEQETGEVFMGEPVDLAAQMHVDAGESSSLGPPAPSTVGVAVALEEDLDLEEIVDIMEELVVDIMPQKSGWVGTPDAIMDYKAEMFLAQKASTISQEELKVQRELVKRLTLENKTLKQASVKYKKLIIEANTRIERSNLTNARLLYTNRVMTNDSLNERQKSKIVEAVQNAGSIEEAKTIFETLQDAVGSIRKGAPKSLSESIERPVGSLPRRKRENNMETRVVDRMQLLAGIKQQ